MGRIALVVGHTIEDRGAVCEDLSRFQSMPIEDEFSFNCHLGSLVFLKLMQKNFAQPSFNVRPPEVSRRAFYKGVGSDLGPLDLVVDMHFNSFGDKTVKGSELLCLDTTKPIIHEYLEEAHKGFTQSMGLRNRGIKKVSPVGNGYVNMLKSSEKGALGIITEPFFGSSSRDCKLVRDRFEHFVNSYTDMLINISNGLGEVYDV